MGMTSTSVTELSPLALVFVSFMAIFSYSKTRLLDGKYPTCHTLVVILENLFLITMSWSSSSERSILIGLCFFPILDLQNVHHRGQPMPGEEQDDVIMTSTQGNLLNVACPLSGKPVTELSAPVRGYRTCFHFVKLWWKFMISFDGRVSWQLSLVWISHLWIFFLIFDLKFGF